MAGPVFPDPTKPKKLKNLLNGTETYDKLHVSAPVVSKTFNLK
jgi:thiamine monophosphate synthase